MSEKVVLAYSGGLDTTAIIPWLKENYNYPLLYGGSVSKDTIEQLKDIPYLEGVLLGKASLRIENVKDFIDKL